MNRDIIRQKGRGVKGKKTDDGGQKTDARRREDGDQKADPPSLCKLWRGKRWEIAITKMNVE